MEHKKVVVVIPVYQSSLSYFEQVSLRRCLSILGNHPIVVIAPQSLDTDFLSGQYCINCIERFEDSYFDGLDGYNRLMLSTEFYERFLEYTYLLICQLDAYVFSDQLTEWCDKGYDYIGAPWIPSAKYQNGFRKTELKIFQFISRLFSLYGSRSNYYHTGNGGFSLRKTETLYRIAQSDQEKINEFLGKNSYHYAEDIYWSLRVNHLKKRLRIPDYKQSLPFAFENHPELLYRLNNNQLPFGAHAWYKEDKALFWKRFIPELENTGPAH